jgi:NAD(P)-dependent dehydrogenase (short-subunit alcohol dehydrogenase family)
MTSQYWDADQAREYHGFRYHFPEKSLGGKTVVVAGGSGGLGAATVALLAREGAHLVVGYRTNRERAEALRAAMESSFGSTVSLVAGDIASGAVREAFLTAAQKFSAPLAGVAIFAGDPARVAFEDLNRETLLASLESNYVGPILLAKELGAAMESSAEGGSVVLLATMQALAVFWVQFELRGCESSVAARRAHPGAAMESCARERGCSWSHHRRDGYGQRAIREI